MTTTTATTATAKNIDTWGASAISDAKSMVKQSLTIQWAHFWRVPLKQNSVAFYDIFHICLEDDYSDSCLTTILDNPEPQFITVTQASKPQTYKFDTNHSPPKPFGYFIPWPPFNRFTAEFCKENGNLTSLKIQCRAMARLLKTKLDYLQSSRNRDHRIEVTINRNEKGLSVSRWPSN